MQNPIRGMKRRDAIKAFGLAAMGTALAPDFLLGKRPVTESAQLSEKPFTGKPVTCIILGAGNRGNTYAAWSRLHPDQMKVVGVAEPIPSRQEKFAHMYEIPDAHRFRSWDDALAVPKFADAILITTRISSITVRQCRESRWGMMCCWKNRLPHRGRNVSRSGT